jgi:hypothetical protein
MIIRLLKPYTNENGNTKKPGCIKDVLPEFGRVMIVRGFAELFDENPEEDLKRKKLKIQNTKV